MMRLSAFAASAFLLTALASMPASAQITSTPKERFGLGPYAGIFLPTESKTRNRFGNSWGHIGLGGSYIKPTETKGIIGADVDIFYQTQGDNHVFFAPVGLQYRRGLSDATNIRPYAGVSVDAIFADIRSLQDNVHSGFKTGVGGSAFVGTTFGNRGFAEARYIVTSKVKSFNLSGASLSIGVNF